MLVSIGYIVGGMLLIVAAGLLIEQMLYYISSRLRVVLTGAAMIFGPLITSAPELSFYLVSLLKGEIKMALGSVVAQPFLVSTFVYPLVLLASIVGRLLGLRTNMIPTVERVIAIPLLLFMIPLIPVALASGALTSIVSQIYGIALIVLYFAYAKYVLKPASKEEVESEIGSHRGLWLRNPVLQLVATVAALCYGSHLLVDGIVSISSELNVNEQALTIVMVPIATALPESIVCLIFISKGKDSAGASALVGEEAVYTTFYVGIALATGLSAYLEPAALAAVRITLMIAALECLAIWFRRFAVTAPIGLAGYIWYLMHYVYAS